MNVGKFAASRLKGMHMKKSPGLVIVLIAFTSLVLTAQTVVAQVPSSSCSLGEDSHTRFHRSGGSRHWHSPECSVECSNDDPCAGTIYVARCNPGNVFRDLTGDYFYRQSSCTCEPQRNPIPRSARRCGEE